MSDLVKTSKNDQGTITVILNRPDVHNAFNDEVIDRICTIFDEIERDETLSTVVLTGEGKSFCAGADLNWMKSMISYSQEENVADSQKLAEMFKKIDTCPLPVIGKVNGHALGGGVGLLAVCDYVLASDKGKFGFTEVNLGLIPAVISPFCIKKIGISQARALFISGEKFDAHFGQKIGLIHKVFQAEEFNEKADEFIAHIESLPRGAKIEAKNLIDQVIHLADLEVTDFTCNAIANQRISAEGQEGMSALLEKRKPNWKRYDKKNPYS